MGCDGTERYDGILYEIRRVFSGKLPVGRNPVSEGERIFSRLFTVYESMEFVGTDIRLIKRKSG